MSRSVRQPWIKDKNGRDYNKTIRHRLNQIVRTILRKDPEEIVLPSEKTVVNDYKVCDFKYLVDSEKHKRK